MEERGPITAHIEGLEAHIRGMYDELVRFPKYAEQFRDTGGRVLMFC